MIMVEKKVEQGPLPSFDGWRSEGIERALPPKESNAPKMVRPSSSRDVKTIMGKIYLSIINTATH